MTEQIIEMTKIMNETCNIYDEQGNHIRNKCGECDCWSHDNHCCCSYNTKEAIALYNAGYRKQIEGVWRKQKFIIFDSEKIGYRCSECKTTWDTPTNFCPYCGAKMKNT